MTIGMVETNILGNNYSGYRGYGKITKVKERSQGIYYRFEPFQGYEFNEIGGNLIIHSDWVVWQKETDLRFEEFKEKYPEYFI